MKPLVVPPRRGWCKESGRRGGEERDGAGGGGDTARLGAPGLVPEGVGQAPRAPAPPQQHRSKWNPDAWISSRDRDGVRVRDGIGAGPEGRHSPIPQLSSSSCCGPPTPSPRCGCPGSPTLGVPSWLRGGLKAQRGAVPWGCGSPDPVCLTGGVLASSPSSLWPNSLQGGLRIPQDP